MSCALNCRSGQPTLKWLPLAASGRNDLISPAALNSDSLTVSFMSSPSVLTGRSLLVRLFFTNLAACVLVRLVPHSVGTPRQVSLLDTDLHSVIISRPKCLHLHVRVAARGLLNLLGVPPTRHNDEVVTVNEAKTVHITPIKNTQRRCSWIHVYCAHRHLHFYLPRRCPLPRSVHRLDQAPTHLQVDLRMAAPRMCLSLPGRRSALCVRPKVS